MVSEEKKDEKRTDDIIGWDVDFCKVEKAMLFNIILAANYLDIKDLLDVTCKTVANMIKVSFTFFFVHRRCNLNGLFFEGQDPRGDSSGVQHQERFHVRTLELSLVYFLLTVLSAEEEEAIRKENE